MRPETWILFVTVAAVIAAAGYLRRTIALLGMIAGLFVFLCVANGIRTWDAPSEYLDLTFDEYKAAMRDAYFNPVGASNISQRTSTTRDGYDAWWRFTVSESDFLAIVTEAATEENGPAEITFSNDPDPPAQWRLQEMCLSGGRSVEGKNRKRFTGAMASVMQSVITGGSLCEIQKPRRRGAGIGIINGRRTNALTNWSS